MKVNVQFVRNTHDINGNYLGVNDGYPLHNDYHGLGVHALNRSQTPTSFDEYIQAHYNYQRDFPDYEVPSAHELMLDLIYLEQHGLIRIETITEEIL
jgi:hypothetical protein